MKLEGFSEKNEFCDLIFNFYENQKLKIRKSGIFRFLNGTKIEFNDYFCFSILEENRMIETPTDRHDSGIVFTNVNILKNCQNVSRAHGVEPRASKKTTQYKITK